MMLSFCFVYQVASVEYHITAASATDVCASPPCLTLAQFVARSSYYLRSNVALVFGPGRHNLTAALTASNLRNVSMISRQTIAEIWCDSTSLSYYSNNIMITFSHSQDIHITNLEFVGCGGNQMVNVDNFEVRNSTFRGQENSGTALELINTTAQIINCTYSSNRNGKVQYIPSRYYGGSYTRRVGGAIIASHSKVNISNNIFENNGVLHYFSDYVGAIYAEQQSIININASVFINNSGHGMLYSSSGSMKIEASEFINNIGYEGVLSSYRSNTTVRRCTFEGNMRCALYFDGSTVSVKSNLFRNNSVDHNGVVALKGGSIGIIVQNLFQGNNGSEIFCDNSSITIRTNEFYNNFGESDILTIQDCIMCTIQDAKVHNSLGAMSIGYSNCTIDASEFKHNFGQIVRALFSKVVISDCEFDNNTKYNMFSEPVLICGGSMVTIINSNFTNNKVPIIGAIFSCRIECSGLLLIANNSAVNGHAIIHLANSQFIGHHSSNATISNNIRSLVAVSSNVTLMGSVRFLNNRLSQSIIDSYMQEGGAITLIQSNAFLDGDCTFEHNHADNGGAILSINSKLYVNGNITIAHNVANRNGGGVYLMDSELNCQNVSTFALLHNTAAHKGGGLHAISSSIKAMSLLTIPQLDTATVYFANNIAQKGGGLSLEANAKLYVLKYQYGGILEGTTFMYPQANTVIFSANSAEYGGAVYVDDDTNSGTCSGDPKIECFFQVLLYIEIIYNLDAFSEYYLNYTRENLKTQSLYFDSENNASISGSTLYGGLIDRCAVSQFAEVRIKYTKQYECKGDGITYLKHVSMIVESDTSVSSGPVKVCLCVDNEHNCTHERRIKVKKGETFAVSLAAIDEIDHTVSAIVHASFKFDGSVVASGQATRQIPAKCTNLTFNVVSPRSSEQLTLYALDGPCKDVDLSKISLDINFLNCTCPIGLQIVRINNEINCVCECHKDITRYVDECDRYSGEFLRKSQSKAWIAFTNSTEQSGYLLYSHCPFDYCNSFNISIDLNEPNGADAQCAFNRSSLLCGSCQPGLSLSLGSPFCLQCRSNWPTLFFGISLAAIIAGVALVAILLVLNMTVAVGSLNGLIFYANIVYANKSILLPFQETSLVTVFISLLNLELRVDTCYFPGMDTYIKTWLKLVFPAYVFCLVGLVIVISSYSIRFSKLIGSKDPVATLGTLILLSYAKTLQVCFESLSVGILEYPDGSSKAVWLPDATVQYFHGKHVPLFLTAVLLLLVGLVYTVLLFAWQWRFYLPKWRIFQVCFNNQRLKLFIETYHAPFTPKHRYWTGLLLIVRAVLYLVAAANVSNDPQLALSAIVFTMVCILFLTAFIGIRMYKKLPLNALDTFFILNTLLFSVFTWYSLSSTNIDQKAVAYTSVLTSFITLWLILLYHVYAYTQKSSQRSKSSIVAE
jgi:predicted outer membrane repeat protein